MPLTSSHHSHAASRSRVPDTVPTAYAEGGTKVTPPGRVAAPITNPAGGSWGRSVTAPGRVDAGISSAIVRYCEAGASRGSAGRGRPEPTRRAGTPSLGVVP